MADKNPDDRILLSDMIENLRNELQEASIRALNQNLVFEIEKAELEAKIIVSRAGKGEAKVQFWVVNAGGGYEQKNEETHTVKLTLTPKLAGGGTLHVSSTTTTPPSNK